MRILGIDYGQKRIGLALSDPRGIIAQPHGFMDNDRGFHAKLLKLLQDQEVSEIVVGLPRSMDGSSSPMTKEVEGFAERLRTAVPVPVHLCDERLTSAQAERTLLEGDVRRAKRKVSRDAIAAALLLQSFLKDRPPCA
ncbi:MAG: Holliday junction resolvase RuvX [Pseudomonadota bacterium]